MVVVSLYYIFPMMVLKRLRFLVALLMLVFECQWVAASNNFIPDSPITNFKLPMFSKEGHRTWFLSGAQGIYVSKDEVNVLGMKINIFSGDARELLEATIESPKAMILINENKACSDDWIEVEGASYHLTGKDWTWDGKLKKMSINKEVKVLFDQSLKGLMSYEKQ